MWGGRPRSPLLGLILGLKIKIKINPNFKDGGRGRPLTLILGLKFKIKINPNTKGGGRGRPPHTLRHSLYQAVVFLQHLAQAVMRQSDHLVIVYSLHRPGGDHGVDYRFFRGLHRRQKDRIQTLVREHG